MSHPPSRKLELTWTSAVAADVGRLINDEIEEHKRQIWVVNNKIHRNPELAYEERKACALFIDTLKGLGFGATSPAYGLETAFSAEHGSGGRLVIFNAEYDALPDIGHACGHNLIAASSLAAFLGLAAALRARNQPGRVRLLGTTAEESGGGKVKLLAAGAYADASACLMVHPGPGHRLPSPPPAPSTRPPPTKQPKTRGVAHVPLIASIQVRATFTGRPAHAALAPWTGLNALDDACLSYTAISMLRQQMRPHERVHGIVTPPASARPNVTPAEGSVEYYVRSGTRADARALWARVRKCFEGAALATGCGVQVEEVSAYADVRPSRALCEAYVDAMVPRGSVLLEAEGFTLAGSSDMGDVCYTVPGFHGVFGIDTKDGELNHTEGFAKVAGTDDAFEEALECGKGMARVGWKVLADGEFAERVRREWEEDMKLAAG